MASIYPTINKHLDAKFFKKHLDSSKKVGLKFISETPKLHKNMEKREKVLSKAVDALVDDIVVDFHANIRDRDRSKLEKITEADKKEAAKKKRLKEKAAKLEAEENGDANDDAAEGSEEEEEDDDNDDGGQRQKSNSKSKFKKQDANDDDDEEIDDLTEYEEKKSTISSSSSSSSAPKLAQQQLISSNKAGHSASGKQQDDDSKYNKHEPGEPGTKAPKLTITPPSVIGDTTTPLTPVNAAWEDVPRMHQMLCRLSKSDILTIKDNKGSEILIKDVQINSTGDKISVTINDA